MTRQRGPWSRARWLGVAALGAASVAFALGTSAAAGAASAPSQGVTDAGAAPDADSEQQQPPACGKPGLPPCPMQAFMRASVSAPLASRDEAALASGLERSARLAPDPTWASWVEAANAGAAAARKGDIASARASCKTCHEAWREAYRAKYRARPIAP